MLNKNKGITLIALVVTIVVLIILATISINVVLGEDGLIQKAEKASQMQVNAEAADQDAIKQFDQLVINRFESDENGDTTCFTCNGRGYLEKNCEQCEGFGHVCDICR